MIKTGIIIVSCIMVLYLNLHHHTSLASARCLLTDDQKYITLFGAHFVSIDVLDIDDIGVYESQIEYYRGCTHIAAVDKDSLCVNDPFKGGYLRRYCEIGIERFFQDFVNGRSL